MVVQLIIPFLADNNVPDSVSAFLREREHDIVRVRDIMASNAPDPIVAEAAMQSNRVLISWDKDFNHQRFTKERFSSLSRIGMSCPEPVGRDRIAENIDRIEFEYRRAAGSTLTIRIGKDKFLVKG